MPKTDTSLSTYTSMMRVTTKGRPYAKDLYDMFAAILLQINLTDHRVMFRTYPYTFTTDEAAKVMSSLVFIHIHRNPDPVNPSKLIATRTTTTFSMNYVTAKNLIQHLLSARLIMSATDPSNCTVKDKGLWCPTLKGKYVMEEFTDSTQVEMSDTLIAALNAPYMSLSSSSTGNRLITLDRLIDNDDQITFSRPNMTATFKAMMASLPRDALMIDEFSGIEKSSLAMFQYTFVGALCIEWLCDRLTVTSREEAESVASEFVLFGWISQVLDKSDKRHHTKPSNSQHMPFFTTERNAIYYVTERGCIVTGWKSSAIPTQNENQSGLSLESDSSSSTTKTMRRGAIVPPPRNRQPTQESHKLPKYEESIGSNQSLDTTRHDSATLLVASSVASVETVAVPQPPEEPRQSLPVIQPGKQRPPSMTITDSAASHSSSTKDNSQWTRLTQILETPLLRMYFRDFLRTNYCVENMNFWVDHHKLLRKNNQSALEQVAACYAMYETYLGSRATADVNIDHTLHQEIISYVTSIFTVVNQPPRSGVYFISPVAPTVAAPNQSKTLLLMPPQATKQRLMALRGISPEHCLTKLLEMLGKVNDHVCRMMAEDSVPKFTKTEKYKELIIQQQQRKVEADQDDSDYVDDYEDSSDEENKDLIRMTTALSDQRSSIDHQKYQNITAAAVM